MAPRQHFPEPDYKFKDFEKYKIQKFADYKPPGRSPHPGPPHTPQLLSQQISLCFMPSLQKSSSISKIS